MRAGLAESVCALRRAPLFRNFSECELFALAQDGTMRRLRRDELLAVEGEEARSVFVLTNGSVRVFREGRDGREQILRIARAVSTLNDLQIFDDGPHPASISACESSNILVLPMNECRRRVRCNHEAKVDALRLLTNQLREAFDLVDSLSLLSVDQRVAQYLLDEARRNRERICDELSVELSLSNQQIGALIGAVREVVSRSLSKLQKRGLVFFRGRTAVIPDEAKLLRFIDSNRASRAVRAAAS